MIAPIGPRPVPGLLRCLVLQQSEAARQGLGWLVEACRGLSGLAVRLL